MEALSHLIEAIGHLLGACAWPAAVVSIVAFLASDIRGLFRRLGRGQILIKGPGGIEGNIQLETAATLGAATESANAKIDDALAKIPVDTKSIADTVEKYVTPRLIRQSARTMILWVDDHPNNNKLERQAIALTGARFMLAKDTSEALEIIENDRIDLIISDMQRPPDMRAGLTLLKRLAENHPPYIIYRSSASVSEEEEAKKLGAFGVTNNAESLFGLVSQALLSKRGKR